MSPQAANGANRTLDIVFAICHLYDTFALVERGKEMALMLVSKQSKKLVISTVVPQ